MEEEKKQPEIKQEETAKAKVSNAKIFFYGLGAVLVLAVLVIGGITVKEVKNLSQNSFVLQVAKMMNLSIAKINGMGVSYADYVGDLQTLNKFYSSTTEVPRPTDEQISDQVLSRLVANKMIFKLAREFKVSLEEKDITEFKDSLIKQFGSEEAAGKELMDKYGWTLSNYIEKVVKPILLEQKLQKAVAGSDKLELAKYDEEQVQASHILFALQSGDNKETIKKQAEDVLQQIKNGADFVQMAAKYSADTANKDQGGDLGWFGKGAMVPEFETAVFALEPGQLAPNLVETQYGFHIIKLVGKKNVKNYFSFMNDQFKNAKIEVLLPVHNPFAALQQTEQNSAPADDAVNTDNNAQQ